MRARLISNELERNVRCRSAELLKHVDERFPSDWFGKVGYIGEATGDRRLIVAGDEGERDALCDQHVSQRVGHLLIQLDVNQGDIEAIRLDLRPCFIKLADWPNYRRSSGAEVSCSIVGEEELVFHNQHAASGWL